MQQVFIEGSITDVRENFQVNRKISYHGFRKHRFEGINDVLRQWRQSNVRSDPESVSPVWRKVPRPYWLRVRFFYSSENRFPHPVTLSGMLEMSRMFLPINKNWTRFIHEAERTYESINSDIQHVLMQIANEACHQAIDDKS